MLITYSTTKNRYNLFREENSKIKHSKIEKFYPFSHNE